MAVLIRMTRLLLRRCAPPALLLRHNLKEFLQALFDLVLASARSSLMP